MSVCATTPTGTDPSVAAYENLRRHVLAGTAFTNHFGLVLLLREGLVAWTSRCATSSHLSEPAVAAQPTAAAPEVFDEIHASVVHVLVGMVLRGPGAMSS